jgi:hypothetical protein
MILKPDTRMRQVWVHFSSGASFHNTQAVVTLSLSKGDGLPKEPVFAL